METYFERNASVLLKERNLTQKDFCEKLGKSKSNWDNIVKTNNLEMLDKICSVTNVPVIASGGAGCIEDFVTLFKTLPKVDAGLAASIFHFKEVSISALKQRLSKEGVSIRI